MEGIRELRSAIWNRDYIRVLELCERGVDVNKTEEEGDDTILMGAIKDGDMEIFDKLLKYNANVHAKNRWGETAATYAARYGRTKMLKTLIEEKGVSVNEKNKETGDTLLIYAAMNGHTDIVKYLISKKAIVDAKNESGHTAATLAAMNGHTEILNELIDNGVSVNAKNEKTGDTLLMYAALCGRTNTARCLISRGANVNAKNKTTGMTAAIYAAKSGHTEILKDLIDHGVDVNAKNEKTGDTLLHTLLMCAVSEGKVDTVRYLIEEKGVDISKEDETGKTAAMYAAMCGNTEKLRTLIEEKGIDVNTKNEKTNNTLLIYAAMHGHVDTIKYLISKDANLNATNKYGYSADTYAKKEHHFGIMEIVKEVQKNGLRDADLEPQVRGSRVVKNPENPRGNENETNHRAGGVNDSIGVHPKGHQEDENQKHDGNGLGVLGCDSAAQLATAARGAGNQDNQRDNGKGICNW